MLAFLNAPSDAVESQKVKIPTLSEETLSMMIERVQQINSPSETVTISDFQDCIATVRESLVASINGADSASGDDYLPLFCYVVMKGLPSYLPSQLQTAKVISQRKEQDKYFIDCCVAMKALRNFCNVLFKTEHDEQDGNTANGQTQGQTPGNDEAVSSQNEQHQEATSKSNGNTKSSLFNTLRSKLPQRTPKQNGNGAANSLFNLSPSNFMNKRNSSANNSPQPSTSPPAVPKETKEPEPESAPKPEQEQNALDTPTDAANDDDEDVMVQVSAKLN